MREIKFRAWDKDNKEMVAVQMIDCDRNHVMARSPKGATGYIKRRENIELMQFTGLHDKSGKEIYEGDIVLVRKDMAQHDYHARIDWFVGGYVIRLPNVSTDWISEFEASEELEVIGNIHENAELLNSAL